MGLVTTAGAHVCSEVGDVHPVVRANRLRGYLVAYVFRFIFLGLGVKKKEDLQRYFWLRVCISEKALALLQHTNYGPLEPTFRQQEVWAPLPTPYKLCSTNIRRNLRCAALLQF